MKKPNTIFSSRQAFTLLELLICIVVLAVLSALLFPVVKLGIQKAKNVACLSNLAQLARACRLYSAEHEDRIPFTYDKGTGRWVGDESGYVWYVAVAPYVGVTVSNPSAGELRMPGPFKCPADTVAWVGGSPGAFHPSCSYSIPIGLAPNRLRPDLPATLRFSTIPSPGNTVLIVDSVYGNVFNNAQITSPGASAPNDPDETMPKLFKRHNGANAAFVDGHCEFLPGKIPPAAPAERQTLWGPILWGPDANM